MNNSTLCFKDYTFEVDRILLLDFLRASQYIVEKKPDSDSSKVKFVIHDNFVETIISDGIICIKSFIEILSSIETKESFFYVSLNILYDLIRKLEFSTIKFTISENKVILNYGNGCFNLLKINGTTSEIKTSDPILSFNVKSSQIVEKLKLVKSTIAAEDIRDQFKGVSAILDETNLILWSTDGHKLSICQLPIQTDKSFKGIWPRKFVECICSISNDKSSEFIVYERHIQYKINHITIISPLINAELLDYTLIVDKDEKWDLQIFVDSSEITKRLERIMILSDDVGRVLLNINSDSSISCNNLKDGESLEKLDLIQKNGTDENIYFNGNTLLSFIRNLKGTIEMQYYKKNKSILIRRKDDKYPIYVTKAMKAKQSES